MSYLIQIFSSVERGVELIAAIEHKLLAYYQHSSGGRRDNHKTSLEKQFISKNVTFGALDQGTAGVV